MNFFRVPQVLMTEGGQVMSELEFKVRTEYRGGAVEKFRWQGNITLAGMFLGPAVYTSTQEEAEFNARKDLAKRLSRVLWVSNV